MKSKVILRKQIAVFSVVCALGLAVFVNWYYTNNNGIENEKPEITKENTLGEAQYVNSNNVNKEDFFAEAKLKRSKTHDEGKKNLKDIINDPKVDEDTKNDAKGRLLEYSEIIKSETDIENLIKAQTNSDCVVTLTNNNVEVVMPKGIINDKNLVKIKEIILSKTKLNSDSITVVELN